MKGPIKNRDVILNLDGVVTPGQFMRGLRDFFGILRSVSRNVTGTNRGVKWRISVKEGSNLVVASGAPVQKTTMDEVILTVQSINGGMQALASGTSESPHHFTDDTLNFAKDLATLAENAKPKGLDKVEIRADGSIVPVSAESAASVNKIRGKEYTAIGSVEGKLQTVSDRRGFKIVVYDSLTDKSVNCYFDDENLLERAVQAFRKRVAVYGEVKYRQDGTPISVKVNRIRVFKSRDQLPPIDEIRGIFNRST